MTLYSDFVVLLPDYSIFLTIPTHFPLNPSHFSGLISLVVSCLIQLWLTLTYWFGFLGLILSFLPILLDN